MLVPSGRVVTAGAAMGHLDLALWLIRNASPELAAEYAAAYRHIVDRFRARGVSNVLWAWTMSGWTASDPSKAWSLQQLWPGPGYVNIILWDPYNHDPSRWRSFAQIVPR